MRKVLFLGLQGYFSDLSNLCQLEPIRLYCHNMPICPSIHAKAWDDPMSDTSLSMGIISHNVIFNIEKPRDKMVSNPFALNRARSDANDFSGKY